MLKALVNLSQILVVGMQGFFVGYLLLKMQKGAI